VLEVISFDEIPEREWRDKGSLFDKHIRKDNERVGPFHTSLQNILMEIKDNLMLRKSKPIETLAKFRKKKKLVQIP